MKKRLFVGLVIIFSVFVLCVFGARSEAANTTSPSINKEIEASSIGFKSVHKIANRISYNSRGSGKSSFTGYFAYSPDGQYLLYTEYPPNDAGKQIVIVNVSTRKTTKIIKTKFDNPILSHDNQRIYACRTGIGGAGEEFSIFEIKSGKHTEVNADSPCFQSMLWYMNEKILTGSERVFSLDSLSYVDISAEEANKIIEKLQPNNIGKAHFLCHFPWSGGPGCNTYARGYLQISNNDKSLTKVMAKDVDSYALSPKYDSILYSQSDGLYLAYLDTSFKTEMIFSVDSFRDSLPDNLKSAYASFINKNELLEGEIYAPKVNPLTGKVVGPEGEAKGTVKIIGESNGKVVVQKIFEKTPFKVGKDVLANIEAPDYNESCSLGRCSSEVLQGNSFYLKIWPTLHSFSEKELGDFKEDQQKQKEITRAAAKEWHEKGRQAINAGDMQTAMEAFNKAIEMDATFPLAYHGRGAVYAKKGQFDDAIENYNKAISLNPDYDAYYDRGFAYIKKGQYDMAIEDYSKVISLKPDYYPAYHDRGFVYYNKDQYDMAIEDFNKVISLNPKDAFIYKYRGGVHYIKGRHDMALVDFKKSCELGNNDGCTNVKVLEGKLAQSFYRK